jgi:hypothetical protein
MVAMSAEVGGVGEERVRFRRRGGMVVDGQILIFLLLFSFVFSRMWGGFV